MRERRVGWWLIGLVLVAVVLPTVVSVPVVALVMLLVVVNRWWVRKLAGGLQVGCSAPEWVYFEESVEAVVEVVNASRLPAPWVEIDVPAGMGLGRSAPYREAVALAPGGRLVRRLPLRGLQRGRHHVGPPRLRVGDVVGVADATVALMGAVSVTVFPRVVSLQRLGLPALSPFVTVPSRRSLLADPTAVVGVREYRVGDPFSAVHWTATARTEQLMVKQYERAEARDTLVCVDLAPQGYPRSSLRSAVELAIIVAASVLHHSILTQHLPAGLLAPAWSALAEQPLLSLPPRADEAHLRRMLELLALAEPNATMPLAELLADVGPLPTGTTVLVVTGTLDATVSANLLRLTRQGVPVAVALTGPSADEDALSIDDVWLPVYRVTDVTAVQGLAA